MIFFDDPLTCNDAQDVRILVGRLTTGGAVPVHMIATGTQRSHKDNRRFQGHTMATDGATDRFAQWLNLTMENRGVRATDLARRLKITDSAVSRWRSGAGVPSMDAVLRLGQILDVDPVRLAVTAGLMDGDMARIAPLPMPEATARRNRVKQQLGKIKGLTERERQHLLDAYDERTEETQ